MCNSFAPDVIACLVLEHRAHQFGDTTIKTCTTAAIDILVHSSELYDVTIGYFLLGKDYLEFTDLPRNAGDSFIEEETLICSCGTYFVVRCQFKWFLAVGSSLLNNGRFCFSKKIKNLESCITVN